MFVRTKSHARIQAGQKKTKEKRKKKKEEKKKKKKEGKTIHARGGRTEAAKADRCGNPRRGSRH